MGRSGACHARATRTRHRTGVHHTNPSASDARVSMAIGVSPCRRSSGSGPTWRHSRSGSVRDGEAVAASNPRGGLGAVTASPAMTGRKDAFVLLRRCAGGRDRLAEARPDRPATGARMLGRLRWAAVMTARRWACPGPGLARSTIDRPGYGESPSPLARSRELGDQTVPSVPIQSGVAQSAERPAVNRRVESSSLSPRAVSSAPRNQVMRSSGRGSGWPGRTRHGQGLDPPPGPSRRNGGARGE